MANKFMEELYPNFKRRNSTMGLMNARLGNTDMPRYKPDTVLGANEMAKRLKASGGFSQQNRMIQDKRRSLHRAMLYSY